MTSRNHFDAIRLAAASQVVLLHAIVHLHLPVHPVARDLLERVPGVPIFFVLSGFLVSQSYERSPSLGVYAWHRVRRIYPALLVCLAVSLASAFAVGFRVSDGRMFGLWLLAQTTVGQFWVPAFWRGYGIGVLNGALWTIPVELQFYALLPILMRYRRLLWPALALGIVANRWRYGSIETNPALWATIVRVCFLPYLWMFVLGILANLHWRTLWGFLDGLALEWWALTGLLSALCSLTGLTATQNGINPLIVVPLAFAVLSTAYTRTDVRLTRGDLSYGTYIYHTPVLNVFVVLGLVGSWATAIAALALISLCAALSWHFVERPILRRRVCAQPSLGLGVIRP